MERKGPAYEAYLNWLSKLKELRQKYGLTQEDVARNIRFSRTRYGAIEKGESIINFVHIYNLAEAFGISMSDFMALKITQKNATRLKLPTRLAAR